MSGVLETEEAQVTWQSMAKAFKSNDVGLNNDGGSRLMTSQSLNPDLQYTGFPATVCKSACRLIGRDNTFYATNLFETVLGVSQR